jgi:transcriptional regulator with GAF, ATPase, and Fis domain
MEQAKAQAQESRLAPESLNLELLQAISLAVAEARSIETVLQKIVTGLTEEAACTLARIWLVAPGDICERCDLRTECPDQTRCLHLKASMGKPTNPLSGHRWYRMDGDFQRFPLGVRIVGRVGATGQSEFLLDTADNKEWIGRDDWLHREGIRTFVGHPLRFRGEILGVLGVFTRERLGSDKVAWLRLFAEQAAVAIANARAFEEIEQLHRQLKSENEYLREEVKVAHGFGEIIGKSSALRQILDQVGLVGPADTTVLISGESGTGKELIARAIHERSRRKDGVMVTVNCSSVPHELFESEFFGHVKGSFTGAVRDRVGRFQLADRGTLFLDEVGEIPLDLQSKLLRVLQEGTFERVGDERTRKVDVRVIAATNRNLEEEVKAGRFREDLYYRLSVFPICVAPLRERLDDVPMLAEHFLERACRRLGLPEQRLKHRHIETLQRHRWSGNVRELQNIIERAVIRAQSGPLEFDLPAAASEPSRNLGSGEARQSKGHPREILNYTQLRHLERENLQAALEATHWRIYGPDGAANLLGVKPTTLSSKMKSLGLRERKQYETAR